jgi:phosphoribosylanthranilate isomerase
VIGAGGLSDANVASVIRQTHVWGVDSASGVESSPGVKDRELMNHFVASAVGAFEDRDAS